MKRLAFRRVATCALLASTALSYAQTTATQPAQMGAGTLLSSSPTVTQPISEWSVTVERFANAMSNNDATAARTEATESLPVMRGANNEASSFPALVERAAGGSVLASHAYFYPPLVMAADLAADFKTSTTVPDDVKTLMIPDDDDAMKRANATAAQWFAQNLGATKDTPVAVAVLLPPVNDSAAKAPTPVLVLMRGKQDASGKFKIDRVVFGTPLQIAE
jgi:hypothetical protein